MLPVTSVSKLIDGMFEVLWVVLTEPKVALVVTFFDTADAGKTTKVLYE